MEEIRITVRCEDASDGTIPCAGKVRLIYCPFDEDVHNIKTPVWLCDAHEHERAMAI